MSAYIVHKATIDLLVSAGLEIIRPYGPLHWQREVTGPYDRASLTHETRNEVGRMLWAENVASIEGHYPDTATSGQYPGPLDFDRAQVEAYDHQWVRGWSPVDVLSIIANYQYQSCEHSGWETSQAFRFCEALTKAAIRRLPGYDDAPWGIDDHNYFRLRDMAAREATRERAQQRLHLVKGD